MPVSRGAELAAPGPAGPPGAAGGLLRAARSDQPHATGYIARYAGGRGTERQRFVLGLKMRKTITRRELLAAAAGAAALSACSVEKPVTPARVSVVRAPAYDQSVYAAVRRLLDEQQVDVRGRNRSEERRVGK